MFNISLLKSHLKTKILGRKIYYYASASSTNNKIWELFDSGDKEGLVVVADSQTQGKGRGNKIWYSNKGTSIMCSFLIKQKFPINKFGLHSILIPAGIIMGIKTMINNNIHIKWPNDIVCENKKLGGVLIETKKINNCNYFNIGFGLNVNDNVDDFAEPIKNIATSMKIISQKDIQRELLLANIINKIDNLIIEKNDANIISVWMENCSHINDEIFVNYNKNIINARFKKINKNGQAILKYNNKNIIFNGPLLNL